MEISATPEPGIGNGSEMSEAIMNLVRPSMEKLDDQIKNTRKSQILLANNINQLSTHLKTIGDKQSLPYSLDTVVSKLDDSQRRVTESSLRLTTIHDRMSALQRNIARETFKRRQSTGNPQTK